VKLATVEHDGVARVGLVVDGGLVDLTARLGVTSMRQLLAGGLERARPHAGAQPDLPLDDGTPGLRWLPPVPDPVHIIGTGFNTRSHYDEVAAAGRKPVGEYPTIPRLFLRSSASQVGHREPMWLPSVSDWLDYEGEVAVVMGRAARYLTLDDALDHVAGYACYDDGSVRDYQRHTDQTTQGKSFPRTGGFGPWIVTRDEAPEADGFDLTTTVNGEVRQRMTSSDFVFSVAELLVYITQIFALQPGDVLISGTTSGSGSATSNWLKVGDVVEVDIKGVGRLVNPVAAEPPDAPTTPPGA
jgi:2-keto-4-pentenoate hydratase/2-oxohepta-3-ene-1,7-dioic acid hydratase in catechol pathway